MPRYGLPVLLVLVVLDLVLWIWAILIAVKGGY